MACNIILLVRTLYAVKIVWRNKYGNNKNILLICNKNNNIIQLWYICMLICWL